VIVDNIHALLLFARLARPTPSHAGRDRTNGRARHGLEVRTARLQRRRFLINEASAPPTVKVRAPGARIDLNRMTP
jgi:hypothetical protein